MFNWWSHQAVRYGRVTGTHSSYEPTWYVATMAAAQERPRLVYDLDVDVCVIGGGLAGLTVAREVARRGWSVAVLEAQRLAWSASGRNAGVVAPGFAERPARIAERVGLDRAKELWALSQGGVEYVRAAIRDIRMPGVEAVRGLLRVQRVDDAAKASADAGLLRQFGTDAEAWPAGRVRESLKSRAYFQAVHVPSAFHIHPLNYALGLAAEAERLGAQIFENTPALAVDPAGVRKRIDVPGARVRAGHVVLAGSAHLSPLFPVVANSVMPIATYVAVTGPLGERLADALTYAGGVADTRRSGDYYRIIDGDRLLWGGRISARLSSSRRRGRLLQGDIRKVYPQLGQVEIAHAWAGVMGYALHKMPQIGEVAPGLWVASAFGGHGLNTTAMAGDLIARAMIEGDDRWRLFAPYDLVGTGGMAGRVAAQFVFWSMRLRDAIEETLARRRERGKAPQAIAPAAAEIGGPSPEGSGGTEAESAPPLAAAEEPVSVPEPERVTQAPQDRPEKIAPAAAEPSAPGSPPAPPPLRVRRAKSNGKKRTDGPVYATRDPQSHGAKVKRRRKSVPRPGGEEPSPAAISGEARPQAAAPQRKRPPRPVNPQE